MRTTFDLWAREGWIRVTPGDVIDYEAIEVEIGRDAEQFDIGSFAYDPWQAEQLRQRLLDGGLEGWPCPQQMAHMAGPSAELERLLGLGAFHHGGNPALAWMAGNAVAKVDTEGRVKPDRRTSAEKIDGIVAAVMAVAASMQAGAVPGDPAAAKSTAGDNLYRPRERLNLGRASGRI
jgi:phage terminase large subunit-like protein